MTRVTEQVRGRASFLTVGPEFQPRGRGGWQGRGGPPGRPLSPPPRVLPPQFTEEKFGQAEKTELDAHFENLLARADSTKNWTEKILRQTEVLLQPNPSKWTRLVPGEGQEAMAGGLGGRGDLLCGLKEAAASVLGSPECSLGQRQC